MNKLIMLKKESILKYLRTLEKTVRGFFRKEEDASIIILQMVSKINEQILRENPGIHKQVEPMIKDLMDKHKKEIA